MDFIFWIYKHVFWIYKLVFWIYVLSCSKKQLPAYEGIALVIFIKAFLLDFKQKPKKITIFHSFQACFLDLQAHFSDLQAHFSDLQNMSHKYHKSLNPFLLYLHM